MKNLAPLLFTGSASEFLGSITLFLLVEAVYWCWYGNVWGYVGFA